ncbi:hypothetical protein NG827_12410 [Xanthomonas sacchari]|nr:hypothetical protein [Xanthomonas sacchari]UYK83281.1 hypothetical protein NG827_12410 [Xanthomonas sacchari]
MRLKIGKAADPDGTDARGNDSIADRDGTSRGRLQINTKRDRGLSACQYTTSAGAYCHAIRILRFRTIADRHSAHPARRGAHTEGGSVIAGGLNLIASRNGMATPNNTGTCY